MKFIKLYLSQNIYFVLFRFRGEQYGCNLATTCLFQEIISHKKNIEEENCFFLRHKLREY